MERITPEFDELLRTLGVESTYVDGTGQRRSASVASCVALCAAFDVDATSPNAITQALRDARAQAAAVKTTTASKRSSPPPLAPAQTALFAPWYALWHDRADAAPQGTFAEMRSAFDTCANAGAQLFGTLPMMPMFTGPGLVDPSPYSPVSRCFLNSLLIDTEALGIVLDPDALAPLRRARDVDHVQYATLLRKSLRGHVHQIHDDEVTDDLERYAAFCAVVEAGAEPEDARRAIERGDAGAADAQAFHRYAQVICERQMRETLTYGSTQGVGVYLDFPLGTHPKGFDTFSRPDLYVDGLSVGAPPDAMFATGQNWAFPPWHPTNIAAENYATLRNHLEATARWADVLRIDHVMGLHRVYVIPDGFPGDDGMYLHYNTDAMFDVVVDVARAHDCAIIGENLGTVPDEIDAQLERRGIYGMYVDALDDHRQRAPRRNEAATLGTHDLPLFFTAQAPDAASRAMFRTRTQRLLESDAPLVIVDLADVLEQRAPHNVPGTTHEQRANWRRRLPAALPLPDLPALSSLLRGRNGPD